MDQPAKTAHGSGPPGSFDPGRGTAPHGDTGPVPSQAPPGASYGRSTDSRAAQQPAGFGNPPTTTDIYPRDAPRWRPRESQRKSWLWLVLLAIVITLGIGGVTFAVLWKSQMSDVSGNGSAGSGVRSGSSAGSAK